MAVCEDAAKNAALSCLSAECVLPSPKSFPRLKDLAKNGLNPPLQNMLAIIQDSSTHKSTCQRHEILLLQQEQAATTPHLKRYAAVLAKVWELILVQL